MPSGDIDRRTEVWRTWSLDGPTLPTDEPILRSRPFRPVVSGLAPGSSVIVRTRAAQSESFAEYRADAAGEVDLAMAPMTGSWNGQAGMHDPIGWIWSMAPAPPRPSHSTTVSVVLEQDGTNVQRIAFDRTDTPPGVELIEIDDGEVLGDLILPAGSGPFPAILALGGSCGGNATAVRRGLSLARHGFAVLALSYFGEGDLPGAIESLPIERTVGAARWLAARPETRNDGIGLIGYSRGAELALMAAHRIPNVTAVAALSPSGLRWGAMRDPNRPAWTSGGVPLAFVPWSDHVPRPQTDGSRRVLSTLSVFTTSLESATASELEDATIPVERIDAPVLLVAGAEDHVWPSCQLTRYAWARLEAHGHTTVYDDGVYCLERVGHRIDPPGGSTVGHPFEPMGEMWLAKGGDPSWIAHAQHQIASLLKQHFWHAIDG